MACKQRKLLDRYLDGQLKGSALRNYKQHINSCAECKNEMNMTASLESKLKEIRDSLQDPPSLSECSKILLERPVEPPSDMLDKGTSLFRRLVRQKRPIFEVAMKWVKNELEILNTTGQVVIGAPALLEGCPVRAAEKPRVVVQQFDGLEVTIALSSIGSASFLCSLALKSIDTGAPANQRQIALYRDEELMISQKTNIYGSVHFHPLAKGSYRAVIDMDSPVEVCLTIE